MNVKRGPDYAKEIWNQFRAEIYVDAEGGEVKGIKNLWEFRFDSWRCEL